MALKKKNIITQIFFLILLGEIKRLMGPFSSVSSKSNKLGTLERCPHISRGGFSRTLKHIIVAHRIRFPFPVTTCNLPNEFLTSQELLCTSQRFSSLARASFYGQFWGMMRVCDVLLKGPPSQCAFHLVKWNDFI